MEKIEKMDAGIIKYCNEYLNVGLTETICLEELKKRVELKINDLITTDFQRFVHVLYKVDVSENKLKKVLQENKQIDAASIISDLIIERLQQKIEARKQFKTSDLNIPDDDKW